MPEEQSIRSNILNDVLEQVPIEKPYEYLCKVIEKTAQCTRKMPKSLKIEEKTIRSYILNEVLENVPIDNSYENLCEVIGNDAIAFYDFQFWYYRFLSGNRDLEFYRSSEPEPLQFSDLPVDAVRLIVDKLEVVEILMLRRVSKPLREFVEKQEFDFYYIYVNCSDDLIHVWYGDRAILYAKNEEAVKFFETYNYIIEALAICGDNYESEALNDLASVLKSPKLQLRYFEFSNTFSCVEAGVVSKFFRRFKFVLKSLKHQIAVRELILLTEHPDDILEILPYLKPGYFEKITINHDNGTFDWKNDENSRKVEQIMQLDQWKQAKELHLLDALHLFPEEVLLQFNNYIIHTQMLDQSQLLRIRTKFAASPVFERCFFLTDSPWEERGFLHFIGVPGPLNEKYRSVRYYPILNTDKLLVFKQFKSGNIKIVKKTRVVQ